MAGQQDGIEVEENGGPRSPLAGVESLVWSNRCLPRGRGVAQGHIGLHSGAPTSPCTSLSPVPRQAGPRIRTGARSSADRASDFGSEVGGSKSLRARQSRWRDTWVRHLSSRGCAPAISVRFPSRSGCSGFSHFCMRTCSSLVGLSTAPTTCLRCSSSLRLLSSPRPPLGPRPWIVDSLGRRIHRCVGFAKPDRDGTRAGSRSFRLTGYRPPAVVVDVGTGVDRRRLDRPCNRTASSSGGTGCGRCSASRSSSSETSRTRSTGLVTRFRRRRARRRLSDRVDCHHVHRRPDGPVVVLSAWFGNRARPAIVCDRGWNSSSR